MTFNSNRKAALAVTAGLVGALTLGGAAVAVPAAFADDSVAVEAGASLQSNWTTEAKVTEATNGQGQLVADPANASFPAGEGQYLVPTKTVNKFGTEKALTDPSEYVFVYGYKAPGDSEYRTVKVVKRGKFQGADRYFKHGAVAGDYRVTVYDASDYLFMKGVSQTFTLSRPTVKGVKVAGAITFDGASTWNTEDLNLVDGHNNKLVNGKDYSVINVQKSDGTTPNVTDLVHAGTYKVTVKGKGAYNFSHETVEVTVNQLDLSKAVVTIPDVQNGVVSVFKQGDTFDAQGNVVQFYPAMYNVDILGYKGTESADLKLTSMVDPEGKLVNYQSWNTDYTDAKGEYTAVFAGNSGDFTGTATVTFHNYEVSAGSLYYGRVQPVNGTFTVDPTKGESWDESKLAIRDGGPSAAKYGAGWTVSYVNTDTNTVVTADALKSAGHYEAVVHANMSKNNDGKVVCAYYKFAVDVLANKLSASNDIAFFFNGEQSDHNYAGVTFDGTDQLKNLATIVKDGDGNVYELGKDYELTVKKDGWGDEVKEAVDAGTYTVTVTPKTFEFDGNASFKLVVKQAKIAKLLDQEVIYTGSELAAPAPLYKSGDDTVAMADGFYKVVAVKDAGTGKKATLKDAGHYIVTVALTDAAKGNYDLADVDYEVTVRKATSFDDVAAGKWYAKAVEKAFDNGYVNGFAGTNLFGPERNITRADAVCILFNMAGGRDMSDSLFDKGPLGYETGFKDVDGKAYYAKALAWANETDVANGYGDGTFRPDQTITREEFAALMCNYASLKGEYEAPSGDLSSFADAGTVSAWAKKAVSWAVENGVMGNGGFLAGTSRITRAEVAAMAVNYQPKPVKTPVVGD